MLTRVAELRQRLQALGANDAHARQVLRRWALAQPQDGGRRRIDDFLPLALRQALPGLIDDWHGLARLVSQHAGEDGSARLLVALADGQTVESVLMPEGRIAGLCVSTQLGCAVGCRFCMTGREGLIRQLGSAEIVAQVVLARTLRPVAKVVFMGMGEPAHNLDNVLEAITLLGTLGQIGHKNLVLSSVGDERLFDRLDALPVGAVRPALALSLHTTQPQRRADLLPRAPALHPRELLRRAQAYARASGYPLQVQWTLIDGVNDGDDEWDTVIEWMAHQGAVLNLIPYNAVPDLPYRRPDWARAAAIARRLHRAGVLTKLRHSAAQDVDGGCGQLRARLRQAPAAAVVGAVETVGVVGQGEQRVALPVAVKRPVAGLSG